MQAFKLFLILCFLWIGKVEAIPLRELIFETMNQEQQGVLTLTQIRVARKLGARWYRQHPDCKDTNPAATASALETFPQDVVKQHEWALEWVIGNMMAAEAELWTP